MSQFIRFLENLEIIRSDALPEILIHAIMSCTVGLKEKRVVYSIPLCFVFRVRVVSLFKTIRLKLKMDIGNEREQELRHDLQ